ncbi:hypothetical protein NM688_g9137 [Phlebia brevispora]|uniref:Uncharacterized protein n=1 Tax=Phlebia brevispora TaxID=194682 RepID=A0ACC1RKV5_9APHY|nr:hypothetical protein NM688_g9137 [Phlebia brevispora]
MPSGNLSTDAVALSTEADSTASLNEQRRMKLPQELSDMIVDFLHDDRDTLKACSLVCRAWVPSSHLHLFYAITVHAAAFSDALLQLLRSSAVVSSSIRVLKVVPSKSAAGHIIAPTAALSVLSCLPALHTLFLHVPIANRERETPEAPRWARSSLRHLELNLYCGSDWTLQTCTFFSLVTVDHLAVFAHFMDGDYIPHRPCRKEPFTAWPVKSVDLTAKANYFYSPASVYLEVFRRGIARDALKSLKSSFHLGAASTMACFREFIGTAGRGLTHLQLDASCIYNQLQHGEHLLKVYNIRRLTRNPEWTFLRACESLETLHLMLGTISSLDYNDDGADAAHPIRHAISAFPSSILEHVAPTLRHLIVEFEQDTAWSTSFSSWAGNVHWSRLEDALITFPALKVVDIRVGGSGDYELERVPMPRLRSAGKLRFAYQDI